MKNTKQKHVAVRFLTPEDVGPRPWGRETLLGLVPGLFSFKKLEIRAGNKGGVQYHHKKNECGYLLSGMLIIRFDTGDGKLQEKILNPGACFHFPPGAVHQEEALTDCVILEVSTPHFNDRVRVEKKYGLPIAPGGLPSTKRSEVVTR